MSKLQTGRDHYPAEFARAAARLPGVADGWLGGERKNALDRFMQDGFPTTRHEDWKYTDLTAFSKLGFEASSDVQIGEVRAIDESLLAPHRFAQLDCHLLVFVNGRCVPALSKIGALPAGANLTSLATVLAKPSDALRAQIGVSVNGYRSALTDLNAAFMSDGLYLDLADGIALDRPVHALFIGSASGMNTLRNLIRLGRHSEATVIEHYVGIDDGQYFTNAVTEIQTAEGSRLSRCKLQQESSQAFHLASVHAHQVRDSHLRLHGVDLGGGLTRNDSNIRLDAPGAEVHLFGVYAPTGRQHVDNHTRIDHAQPHGTSREAFKGVLDGNARGVFNGKIVVHKDAQKTDSQQSSAALLLSRNARVDAKPELEIYTDDVKCAHGSTIGQLDEEAVFYLQSRGVDETGARSLLTYSFADEIIREVRIEALRRHIETHFLARLPNGQQFRDLL